MSSGTRTRHHDVVVMTGAFLPGYKAGGPIKSIAETLERLPETISCLVVTADRDVGDQEPYPGLSGRTVPHGRHEVHYVDAGSPRHWWAALRRVRAARPRLLYVNSFFSPLFTVLPVIAARARLLPVDDVLVAPRGELSPGALGIKSRKKRLFAVPWSWVLRSVRPTFQASTDVEAGHIRDLLPWARVLTQINSPGPEPRSTPAEPAGTPRFVFLSRISEKKNPGLALAAVQLVPTPLVFDIYGPVEDQDLWDRCLTLMSALPETARATYRGPLAPTAVQETLAGYDGLVLPTLGENFGHVVTEALAAGCPVICSDETPWSRVLEDGGGVVVPAFDAAAWAGALEARASQSVDDRRKAKEQALAAYRRWRAGLSHELALETVLAGHGR